MEISQNNETSLKAYFQTDYFSKYYTIYLKEMHNISKNSAHNGSVAFNW